MKGKNITNDPNAKIFTADQQKVLEYAAWDKVLYIAFDQSIRREMSKVIYAREDGVLLYTASAQTWLLSAKSENTCRLLLQHIPAGHWVILHEIAYRHILEAKGLRCFSQPAYSSAYLHDSIQLHHAAGAEIRPLTMKDFAVVKENYLLANDDDYIKSSIRRGMLGAFDQDTLMGFIGTHDEGSMGMLEVLPPYRRRGLALALSTHLIAQQLASGFIPYDQFFISNKASQNLQEKLGFSFSQQPLIWMKQPL